MKQDIEKKFQVVQPKGLSKREKNFLWSRIENGIEVEGYIEAHRKSSQSPLVRVFSHVRVGVAALVALGLIGGSFGTAAYADNSKPGDFLYGIDVATEKVKLALASKDKKDEIRLEIANERVDEVRELLAIASDPIDIEASVEIAEAIEVAEVAEVVDSAVMMMIDEDPIEEDEMMMSAASVEESQVEPEVEVVLSEPVMMMVRENEDDLLDEELEELDEIIEEFVAVDGFADEAVETKAVEEVEVDESVDRLDVVEENVSQQQERRSYEDIEDVRESVTTIREENLEKAQTRKVRAQKTRDEKAVRRANDALKNAMDYLEESKDVFLKDGDDEKRVAIDEYIEELSSLSKQRD